MLATKILATLAIVAGAQACYFRVRTGNGKSFQVQHSEPSDHGSNTPLSVSWSNSGCSFSGKLANGCGFTLQKQSGCGGSVSLTHIADP
ncbi:hypothetical protein HDV00_005304 [Rhizophlyctis rosea]|nr:hypothetical protein HDV00_005304 [Rhizophlyctis rosea]